ncbi:hypothetical protein [Acinetobacter courvalinii]|uniref:Uncharacterized protein n=1 Tax=Acinetobacter courvalinii TaxID=280147 RepID=A0AA42I7Y8_9GAMM|nr:hypothetical protein [Acinetobacter courvalinii]MDH0563780.1 hypothetical protein [Acinetobacter courvalinii]
MYSKYYAIKEIINDYIRKFDHEPDVLFINEVEFMEISKLPEVVHKTRRGGRTFDTDLNYVLIDIDIKPCVFSKAVLDEVIDKRRNEDRVNDKNDEIVEIPIIHKVTLTRAGTDIEKIPALLINAYSKSLRQYT